MYFGVFIVIKGYRNSSEKAVSYFIINMGGIIVVDESTAGQTKRTKKLTLPQGEVDFELVGITVPDSRATYYVCFSNNVDVVSGITSAKVDFEPGSQFFTKLRLNVKPESASNPVNCRYFDPTTSQAI
ncbi:hypothetical protein ACED29_03185 [Shewanella sp. 5S214]|uniref:hypothetical protein n=1 Tax=Shewanella sp. 5S214 TaxID=3229999 RepID=UPI00352DBA09